MFNISSNGGWWIIGPMTAFNIGFVLPSITLLEFVWAQAPRPFSRLLTGLTFMSIALSAFIGYGICKIVPIVITNDHGWFYSSLSIALIIFMYFMLFHCLSKRYKMRKRNDIVPIHLFAKEFIQKEMRGRERFDKERSLWKKNMTIVQ